MLLRLSPCETDLEAFLPDRWAASHPEFVLEHQLDESRRKAARQPTRNSAMNSSGRSARMSRLDDDP
ncbi:hypothetical protein [Singulisphaera sp. GP187]|uniref:hypothetical protein n=1 Tax=Singulisphaera sp. GP187 TaxID=1882752 RepID=UPI001C1FEAF2|nr:hypothetical protein [Singulisphaera sp. GP187]